MKATLEFNLPEDNSEFELATNGSKMHIVLWEMDQWLRAQYKYMPDEEFTQDRYDAYLESREKLRELCIEHNVDLDL